jgi:DNA polymerase-3 subunit epsilon
MRPRTWRRWWEPSPDWADVTFWVLDLETTGLDPVRDHMLAVGMAPIRAGTIRYGERFHTLVRPARLDDLPMDGLRAHHLLPSELADAPSVADVLPDIDRRLREGALVVHVAAIDLAFLGEAYRHAALPWPRPPVIDTVDLLRRWHARRHAFRPHPPPPPVGLAEARAAFALPPHQAHDALADALATAELFLVLRSALDVRTLRQLR